MFFLPIGVLVLLSALRTGGNWTASVPQPCLSAAKPVQFWASDLSSGVVEDFKYMLAYGARLDSSFVDNSRSADCAAFSSCISPSYPLLTSTDTDRINLCPWPHRFRRKVYETFQQSPGFQATDVFVSSDPLSAAELWMPFNKSQLLIVASPFETGRENNVHFWQWVNNFVAIKQDKRNMVVAASDYHQRLVKYFTGVDVPVVPSYAGHVGYTYTPSSKLNTVLLVHEDIDVTAAMPAEMRTLAADLTAAITASTFKSHTLALASKPDWSRIAQYRAAVILPSALSSELYVQLYRLNLPLFVPSLPLLMEWEERAAVLANRVRWRFVPGMTVAYAPYHPYDPAPDAVRYWFALADFYKWPHVQQFNSTAELSSLLRSADLKALSASMEETNRKERTEVVAAWTKLFHAALGSPRLSEQGYALPTGRFDESMRLRYRTLLPPEPPVCVRKVCQKPTKSAWDKTYADHQVAKHGFTCLQIEGAF